MCHQVSARVTDVLGAGTILRSTLDGLSTQARKNAEAFAEVGVKVFDADGNMRNMADSFGLEDDSPDIPSWHADAACRDRPDVTWFPERADDWRPAVAVCNECPVRQECLQWAMDNGETIGVWGGLTSRQRERQARQAA